MLRLIRTAENKVTESICENQPLRCASFLDTLLQIGDLALMGTDRTMSIVVLMTLNSSYTAVI